ncbi:MAG: hypothetical protein FJ037_02135 [Chloroflexi bacterium]|nr:hypothetical protein [Chloroflexota bacterium]
MGCPVHIWVPLMAAAAPFARSARDHIRGFLPKSQPPAEAAPRELHRWSPVGASQANTEADQPAR